MTNRGYRTMSSVWDKITALSADYKILPLEEVYKEKMNDDYFNICYYNLYEKMLCGGIMSMTWYKIESAKNSYIERNHRP